MKSSLFTWIIDLLSPRLCAGCSCRLNLNESVLCSTCLLHISRTGYELNATDNKMARLLWGQFPIERCAAWAFYRPDTEFAKMIHSMKYQNRPDIAYSLGVIIARDFAAHGFFKDIDAIVPIPLTKERLHERGYNQSEEFAIGLSKNTGIKIITDIVQRTSFADSQTHLNYYERRDNVEHAFVLTNHHTDINGKHILLVDDVLTTGSTMTACAKQLSQIPNIKISILTIGYAGS